MSERQAEYNVERKLFCSCGAELAVLRQINGRTWVNVGTMTMRNYHGICNECDGVVHHDDLDYIWRRRTVEALANVDVE